MASTYTNSGFELIGDDEQFEQWGYTENTNKGLIDEAINGVVSLALTETAHTLTTSDGETGDTLALAGRHKVIVFTGTPGGTCVVTIDPNDLQKVYVIHNKTDEVVRIAQGSGDTVNVLSGLISTVYCTGTGTGADVKRLSGGLEHQIIPASDETSDLTIGTAKISFRAAYAFNIYGIRASCNTNPTGQPIIADVKVNGTSVFSTLVSIDAGDTTSVGATIPSVISNSVIGFDSLITVDITQVGSILAGTGLKILLLGSQ